MTTERDAFEKAFDAYGLFRTADGYVAPVMNERWQVWKKAWQARAALTSVTSPAAVPTETECGESCDCNEVDGCERVNAGLRTVEDLQRSNSPAAQSQSDGAVAKESATLSFEPYVRRCECAMTSTLSERLAAIRGMAEKATPGPWEDWPDAEGRYILAHVDGRQLMPAFVCSYEPNEHDSCENFEANAAYIASIHELLAIATEFERIATAAQRPAQGEE